MNAIFGTAGFAKEVDWLTDEIYRSYGVDYRPECFVAEEGNAFIGSEINGRPVCSESDFFSRYVNEKCNCFIAVGNPQSREKIVLNIKEYLKYPIFPNIVHPDVSFDRREGKIIMGEGNIICSKNVLTTDIIVRNFVHMNLDCTVGHDSIIGNFVTCSPGVHLSGYVTLHDKVYVGTGAVIIEKIDVFSESIIGAGSTVVKHIVEKGTYVGSPARKIK